MGSFKLFSKKNTEQTQQTQKRKSGIAKIALSFALTFSAVGAVPLVTAEAASAVPVDYVKYHVVKKGDTMYSIAKRNKTSVERLMDANHKLDPTIYVGQRIGIPAKDWPWDGRVFAPGEKITSPYFVGSGDTLYSIAKRTGTTVAKLKKLNGLKSNYIQVGQLLKVTGTNVEK